MRRAPFFDAAPPPISHCRSICDPARSRTPVGQQLTRFWPMPADVRTKQNPSPILQASSGVTMIVVDAGVLVAAWADCPQVD